MASTMNVSDLPDEKLAFQPHHELRNSGSEIFQPHHDLRHSGSEIFRPHHELRHSGSDVFKPHHELRHSGSEVFKPHHELQRSMSDVNKESVAPGDSASGEAGLTSGGMGAITGKIKSGVAAIGHAFTALGYAAQEEALWLKAQYHERKANDLNQDSRDRVHYHTLWNEETARAAGMAALKHVELQAAGLESTPAPQVNAP